MEIKASPWKKHGKDSIYYIGQEKGGESLQLAYLDNETGRLRILDKENEATFRSWYRGETKRQTPAQVPNALPSPPPPVTKIKEAPSSIKRLKR
jgi:hypothetical protein